MKITVCSKCGSQDVERMGWVSVPTGLFVGEYIDNDTYCNKCGERQPTHDIEYTVSEKYGSAYRLVTSSVEAQTYIVVAPMLKNGRIETESECEVDLYNAFTQTELAEFYVEMHVAFNGDPRLKQIFAPYKDNITFVSIYDWIHPKIVSFVDELATKAHENFQTVDGHIYPDQQFTIEDLQKQLASVMTHQVKQNLK